MTAVIAAGNPQTAQAGASILRQGGNAVDAAVAAAFASFVAETGVVHLGGSGMAQLFDPQSDSYRVYDFFSAMPGLGRDALPPDLDFERVTINYGATTQDFYLGRGSVAVPGNIFGLFQLAADFGRLPPATILQPAIELAQNGAILDQFQADTCELLRPLYTHTPSMRAVFEPQGRMVQAGDRLFIPGLTHTLQELAQNGPAALRSGHLGRAFLQDQAQRGGLITEADLAHYAVQIEPPIRISYRQYVVLLPPPCSTGGVLTAFALKVLASFDVRANAHNSAAHLRLLYEIMAAATRARPLWGELSASKSPGDAVSAFLDESVTGRFAQEVQQALRQRTPSTAATEPPGPSNTSHLSVIDDNGMAVALTTTAGESAGYVVPATGFIPNNILGEEDLSPNGFHQWPAGQRIPTMMTPTIVLKDGRIRLVTGSGGSNRIRSALLQTLVNALDYDMPLQEAVSAARVHVEDGILQCEWGYDERAVDELEAMGYPVNRWSARSIYFGGAHSVACDDAGRLEAAGDDRRGGSTVLIDTGA